MKYEVSTEEQAVADKIKEVYNSGRGAESVELAIQYLKSYPESVLAHYNYAVMHGDFSYDVKHSEVEKQRLVAIAKAGIKKLFEDPDMGSWPEDFRTGIQNEYYWFFELPDKQYELGLQKLKAGKPGHYSACVGASMMALKELRAKNVSQSELWAERSLHHFEEFQKRVPDWYNINLFAARALASVGKYDEARKCFKGMYQKQKSAERPDEIATFEDFISEVRPLRGD